MVRFSRQAVRSRPLVCLALLVLVGLGGWPLDALATVPESAVPARVRPNAPRPGRSRSRAAATPRRLTRAKATDRQLLAALAVRPVAFSTGTFTGAMEAAPALSAPERADLEVSLQDEILPPSASPALPLPRTPPLIWPIQGPVNSPFGPRRGRVHAGMDIGGPTGQPIVAAAEGLVLYARPSHGPMGTTIVLQHAAGLLTIYAHLARLWAREGTTVQQGEPIGTVGRTGHTTGPHLHFAVRAEGRTVNPQDFLSAPYDVIVRSTAPEARVP